MAAADKLFLEAQTYKVILLYFLHVDGCKNYVVN